MSQENVEVVRRFCEVFLDGASRRDFGAVFDQELAAPVSSVFPPTELLGPEEYVGRAGFVEWVGSFVENFADWRISAKQIIDAGPDQVLVIWHQTARGRGSGAAVEEEFALIYTLENAQVTHQQVYLDPADALKAVGLED